MHGMTKRPGRPSKGPRQMRCLRLPLDVDRGLVELADRRGVPINDLVTMALREHLSRSGSLPQGDDELKLTG